MGTYPYEFIYPSNIFVTSMFYALQLLVVEDLYSRFKLSYKDLFLIGILWGVLEEGALTLTNYTPMTEWLKPGYGRFLGLNTVWMSFLTFFHAVYTVTLTFLIVDRFFPRNVGPVLTKKVYALIMTYLMALYIGNPVYVIFHTMPAQLHFNFKPRIEAVLIVALLAAFMALIIARRVRSMTLRLEESKYAKESPLKRNIPIMDFSIVLILSTAWWIPYAYQYERFPEVGALIYNLLLATIGSLAFSQYINFSGGVDEKRLTAITASLTIFYISFSILCYFLSQDHISTIIIFFTLLLELELIFRKPMLLRLFSYAEKIATNLLSRAVRWRKKLK